MDFGIAYIFHSFLNYFPLFQMSYFKARILIVFWINKAQSIKLRIHNLTLKWILICCLLKFRLFKQTPMFRFIVRIHFRFMKRIPNVWCMEMLKRTEYRWTKHNPECCYNWFCQIWSFELNRRVVKFTFTLNFEHAFSLSVYSIQARFSFGQIKNWNCINEYIGITKCWNFSTKHMRFSN